MTAFSQLLSPRLFYLLASAHCNFLYPFARIAMTISRPPKLPVTISFTDNESRMLSKIVPAKEAPTRNLNQPRRKSETMRTRKMTPRVRRAKPKLRKDEARRPRLKLTTTKMVSAVVALHPKSGRSVPLQGTRRKMTLQRPRPCQGSPAI